MICRKCDNKIQNGTKCAQCGYDNSEIAIAAAQNPKPEKKQKPLVLIIVSSLFVLLALIKILSRIGAIFGNAALANITTFFPIVLGISNSIFSVDIPGVHYIVPAVITMAVAIFEIALCVNMFKIKTWVFGAYALLICATGVLRMINDAIRLLSIPDANINIMGSLGYSIFPFFVQGLLLVVVYMIDVKYIETKKNRSNT
ncbi:MAG: hypothetical protein FWH48_03595 [Oscillospiraceae bacterium]|nr:hypothetical protein [Oscillospiraceae bacterium]